VPSRRKQRRRRRHRTINELELGFFTWKSLDISKAIVVDIDIPENDFRLMSLQGHNPSQT
jgi:hypothetical protein